MELVVSIIGITVITGIAFFVLDLRKRRIEDNTLVLADTIGVTLVTAALAMGVFGVGFSVAIVLQSSRTIAITAGLTADMVVLVATLVHNHTLQRQSRPWPGTGCERLREDSSKI